MRPNSTLRAVGALLRDTDTSNRLPLVNRAGASAFHLRPVDGMLPTVHETSESNGEFEKNYQLISIRFHTDTIVSELLWRGPLQFSLSNGSWCRWYCLIIGMDHEPHLSKMHCSCSFEIWIQAKLVEHFFMNTTLLDFRTLWHFNRKRNTTCDIFWSEIGFIIR